MKGIVYVIPKSLVGKTVIVSKDLSWRKDGRTFKMEEGKVSQKDLEYLKSLGYPIVENIPTEVVTKPTEEKTKTKASDNDKKSS